MTVTEELFAYAQNTYGVVPDYPFSTAPTYAVLRHLSNRKWFALFMDVPRSRLGLDGEEKVDILNIKCDPILSGSLRLQEGYFPAYHMNHDGWLTILLDGTVPTEEIIPLLDMSFELTMVKPKRSKKKNKE
ncbi:MAG: MmcQ/YjbR family DNA-binding protein [Ruminococcus sp.]|nr:MmcQ/YjbR family DNA-binding protein [Ruminococcus sp.]